MVLTLSALAVVLIPNSHPVKAAPLANIPSAPTVTTVSSTSLKVIVNPNANPDETQYAIYAQPQTIPLDGEDLTAWYSATTGLTLDGDDKVQEWQPRYPTSGLDPFEETADDGGSPEGPSTPPVLAPDDAAGPQVVRFVTEDLTALKNTTGVGVNFNTANYTFIMIRNMDPTSGFPESYETILSAPSIAIRKHLIHHLLADESVDEQGFHGTPETSMWSLVVDGTSYKTYLDDNGVPMNDSTLARNGLITDEDPVYLGRELVNWPGFGTFSATMDIAELLIFERALTPEEIATVYTDLTYQYLQADGSLGTSPVWQTYDQWGGVTGVTNTGLDPDTDYHYQVKARNIDLTETLLSAAGFASAPSSTHSGGTAPSFENLPNDSRPINLDEGQTITDPLYTLNVLPEGKKDITKVEFYVDDTLICTDTEADSNGVYSCDWDTTKYHSTVKIIAYDTKGNTTTLIRNVTIDLTQNATTLPQTGADSFWTLLKFFELKLN